MQFQDTKFKELDAKGLITEKLQQIDEFEALHNPNTCLLYTSPSPRDRTRSRMPSSA